MLRDVWAHLFAGHLRCGDSGGVHLSFPLGTPNTCRVVLGLSCRSHLLHHGESTAVVQLVSFSHLAVPAEPEESHPSVRATQSLSASGATGGRTRIRMAICKHSSCAAATHCMFVQERLCVDAQSRIRQCAGSTCAPRKTDSLRNLSQKESVWGVQSECRT
jgi:hypothetical protein